MPKFRQINCSDVMDLGRPSSYGLCLNVNYYGNGEYDVLLLSSINEQSTLFEGILMKEKQVVSACIVDPSESNELEVSLIFSLLVLAKLGRKRYCIVGSICTLSI